MESRQSHYVLAAIACGVLGALVLGMSAVSAAPSEGEKLAFNRSKGNCIACHAIKGGSSVGNIGPALADMKKNYPDRKALIAIISDEPKRNPLKSHSERQGNRGDCRFPLHPLVARVSQQGEKMQ